MRRAVVVVAVAAILGLPASAPVASSEAGPLGPEMPVADPVTIAGRFDESSVEVAAGDTGFFAVWEDERVCCSQKIYGARLDQEARPLDPLGIAISPDLAYEPHVAWSGTEYVVVWDDYEAGVAFARVSPDGDLLDSPPRHLESPGRSSFAPDVASTGNGSLVVWSGCSPSPDDCDVDLYGAVIQGDGQVRGPYLLVAGAGRQDDPSVAAGDGGYVVTWESDARGAKGAYALRVDETGVPAGPLVLLAAGEHRATDIAFSGSRYLVVWESRERDLDVLGMRLSRDGAPVDEARTIAFGKPIQWAASVAPDRDGGWFVVWEDRQQGRDVYGTHVSAAGTPAALNGRLISDAPREDRHPAVAFDGNVRTIVWASAPGARSEYDDAYGVAERADGAAAGAPHPIALGFNLQVQATAAFNGRVYLVVWEDDRGGSSRDVYGARVTASGRMLDGSGFRIASPRGGASGPRVASDGQDFLVAWDDSRSYRDGDQRTDVYGARVLADGTVAARDVPISTSRDYQQNVELAWTGSSYLAVWEDLRSGIVGDFTGHADLYATAISSRGRVAAPGGLPVVTGGRHQGSHDIATGGGTVVSWTEGCHAWFEEECRRDVFATRVTAAGRPVGERLKIARKAASESYPTGMLGPRGYYVVWLETNEGRFRLMGRRLRAGGRLTRPRVVARPRAAEVHEPELAWTGTFGLLTWNEWGDLSDPDVPSDVLGLRLSANGRRLDRNPLPIAAPEARAFSSATIAGPPGCGVALYSRRFEPPDAGYRSYARFVGRCPGG